MTDPNKPHAFVPDREYPNYCEICGFEQNICKAGQPRHPTPTEQAAMDARPEPDASGVELVQKSGPPVSIEFRSMLQPDKQQAEALAFYEQGTAVQTIQRLERQNAVLRKALDKAAKRFREYEEIHLAKGPEGGAKARRNAEMAEICERAALEASND